MNDGDVDSKTDDSKDDRDLENLETEEQEAESTETDDGSMLPSTATNLYQYLLIGVAILSTGIVILYLKKKELVKNK